MKRFAIVTRELDTTSLIDEVRSPQYGAISVFVGTVRETNEGRAVSAIEYSSYKSMAEAELGRILEEAEERFAISTLIVEHRVGVLGLGEVSVAVVAAHAHRAPALDCTRYVIEELKKRVPIWKLEHYDDGTREWVDPTHVPAEAQA
jgi:molybdopterin synthase catalytic subunit